jgi:peptidyl-dipeptidase Dcp
VDEFIQNSAKLAGDVKLIMINNMNLNKTAEDEPMLMSYLDAVTLCHEFGHALHGLLSDVTYPTLASTSVPRDWIEFPAQLYEYFIEQPYMLERPARHYRPMNPIRPMYLCLRHCYNASKMSAPLTKALLRLNTRRHH